MNLFPALFRRQNSPESPQNDPNLPLFPLRPWDRNRPRHEPPRTQKIAQIGEKTYLLRAQNGLLFFRDQNRDEEEWTWIIAQSLPPEIENSPEEWPAFLENSLKSENVARYVLHFENSSLYRELPLFFKADGTGFCREAWNHDDLPFKHQISMHEWMEAPASKFSEAGTQIYQEHLEHQLEALEFPPTAYRKIEWLCGSAPELKKVATWICHLESGLWAKNEPLKLSFGSENEFVRAGVSLLEQGENEWLVEYDSQDRRLFDFYDEAPPLSENFWLLTDLALDYNTPTSLFWEYHDEGVGRTADSPRAQDWKMTVAPPSDLAHEKAEKELRAWLKNKVSDAEIERIFSNGNEPKS